jgi:hypothetical protein
MGVEFLAGREKSRAGLDREVIVRVLRGLVQTQIKVR